MDFTGTLRTATLFGGNCSRNLFDNPIYYSEVGLLTTLFNPEREWKGCVFPRRGARACYTQPFHSLSETKGNGMGNNPFVDAAESASFPLPGTSPFFSGRIFLFIQCSKSAP